ncbi:MAG: TIGR00269 family protein [Candidatus Heimdallarchaeota archaeon]|nr:TIGR00269 family protein [Candidatus Heimdallarchaeota archaeon]MCK4876454.1 TIGR00269 family protein [Candidatus Heimdallarchaeota archaeon]
MNCAFCDKQAVYVRPYDKIALCKQHFNEQVVKRVQKTLTRYKMLKRRDRIAIGVSGGKDSIALLHILNKIEEDFPESELVAITIDEGIENYREEGLFFAKKHVEELELEHHIFSFKNDFGYNLDEILKILGERGKEREYGACSYCGILRRKILNKAAKGIGADVLVTAHNLEDEVETILLNIVRGDIQRLARLDPSPRKIHESLVPRVKPFRATPQAEIVLFCVLNDLEYQEIPCPYAVEAYRGDVREFIFKTQEKQPMLSFNILRGNDKLLEIMKTAQPKGVLKNCENCGEATSGNLCKACWLKKQLDERIIK